MASIKPVNSHPEWSRSLNSDAMAPFVAKTREVSPLETKTPEPFSARVVSVCSFRQLTNQQKRYHGEHVLRAPCLSIFDDGFWVRLGVG
jgi:hypothetical protein